MLNEQKKKSSTDFKNKKRKTSEVEKITWTASVQREKLHEDYLISGPKSFVFFLLIFFDKSAKFIIMKAEFMTEEKGCREKLTRYLDDEKCWGQFMKNKFSGRGNLLEKFLTKTIYKQRALAKWTCDEIVS